jgi:hypothetical protein
VLASDFEKRFIKDLRSFIFHRRRALYLAVCSSKSGPIFQQQVR